MVLAVLVMGSLVSVLATRPVAAAPDPANVLDRPIVDAAFVDRGPGQPPDLLTLASDEISGARLALLRHGERWVIRSERELALPTGFDGFGVWMTQLSADRFVTVAQTNEGTSELRFITIDEGEPGAIRVGDPIDLPFSPNGAGAADVDGDGLRELVVAGSTGGQDSDCQRAYVSVLSTDDTFVKRVQHAPRLLTVAGNRPIAYLSGAAFGQWDDRPGVDLLLNGYECAAEQAPSDGSDTHHVIAIRLADLATIKDLPTSPVDVNFATPFGNPPAVIDMDGNGRNEAIVTTSVGYRLIDPEDGWRVTPFGTNAEAMLAAVDRAGGSSGTTLVFLHDGPDLASSGVAKTLLGRYADKVRIDDLAPTPVPGLTEQTLDAAIAYLRESSWADQPASSVVDIDGDGCSELLAPRMTVGCLGTRAVAAAPAWTSTRPLTAIDSAFGRSLLVADGLDWYPGFSGPTAPSPSAVHPVGTWRTAMTSRFVLAEISIAGGTVHLPTVPPPTIERAVTQDGQVQVARPAGTRLLMRVLGLGDTGTEPRIDRLVTPDGFLLTEGSNTEFVGPSMYIGQNADPPVMTGFGSGAGSETIDLRQASNFTETGPVSRWVVTVAALDPSGTLSAPVQRTAAIDTDPPKLDVDVPFTSAPWPLSTTLHGIAEAGASVGLIGGPFVTARADGSFDVPAQLAPWPQTFDLIATDEAGNQTRASASVMGGIDIRPLPWPAIGVVVVLVAVFLSSIRGVRSGPRQVRPLTVEVDDENATVIEELSVGRIDRRD